MTNMNHNSPYKNDEWSKYSLFGLTLASNFPFTNWLSAGNGPADLSFTCSTSAPLPRGITKEPSYASPNLIDEQQSFLYVYQQAGYDVLLFSEVAAFYIWPNHIVCHLLDKAYDFMVELHFLGFVLSYWLERQGLVALHASATVVDERAVGFLATNKGGKSSLSACLMQLGYPLLTDDILVVERREDGFLGRPSYPQMRMWPELAEHFLGHYERLEQIHPKLTKRRVPVGSSGIGSFCNISQPLICLYLPERREEGNIEISSLSLGKAVIELVHHSFLVGIVEAVGFQTSRFQLLADFAKQVSVRRLVYPDGLHRLPEVRNVLLDDLKRS